MVIFFFFKQKTAYEMRISDWSSDVCSSDLETDVGIVRFAIDLGPGLFGASQIQCVAAGYMLDIRIVTEQAPPAEAEREISAAVISLAREVGLVATLRCVVGERDLLDFEGGTRLDLDRKSTRLNSST